jgi:hypothetical protein
LAAARSITREVAGLRAIGPGQQRPMTLRAMALDWQGWRQPSLDAQSDHTGEKRKQPP